MKRIVFARPYHETSNFAIEVTGTDRFTILRGDELLGCIARRTASVVAALPWRTCPIAHPSSQTTRMHQTPGPNI